MKIIVIGGTGLIGSKLVEKFQALGHTAIPVSRQSGIDTIASNGLFEVMKHADAVVDVSNPRSVDESTASDLFQRSTFNLITTEVYAGVKHHIALSVVGADRLEGSSYFQGKVDQEAIIKESGIPYTILRSAPFFEHADRVAQANTIGEEVYISPAPFQPVAADEVIAALTNIVESTPINDTVEIAGPVLMPMYEFIRYYLTMTEDSRQLFPDKHAHYFGAKLNNGSLVPGTQAYLGKITYEDWFHTMLMHEWS